jgi:hypothetical protein
VDSDDGLKLVGSFVADRSEKGSLENISENTPDDVGEDAPQVESGYGCIAGGAEDQILHEIRKVKLARLELYVESNNGCDPEIALAHFVVDSPEVLLLERPDLVADNHGTLTQACHCLFPKAHLG